MTDSWPTEFDDLLRAALPFADPGPIDPEANLFALGLDSLRVVSLVVGVESSFGIAFPDDLLTPDLFATGAALWAAADSLRAASDRGAQC